MFLEISKKKFEKSKMRELFENMNIQYEISDCTLPDEKEMMLHIEFSNLSVPQKEKIENLLENIYGEDTVNKDRDGNGVPDYLDNIDQPEVIEKRHRKWDDRMHTAGEETKGFITGANTEEDVTYESR